MPLAHFHTEKSFPLNYDKIAKHAKLLLPTGGYSRISEDYIVEASLSDLRYLDRKWFRHHLGRSRIINELEALLEFVSTDHGILKPRLTGGVSLHDPNPKNIVEAVLDIYDNPWGWYENTHPEEYKKHLTRNPLSLKKTLSKPWFLPNFKAHLIVNKKYEFQVAFK